MLTNSFFGTLLAVNESAVMWGGQTSFGNAVYFPVTVLKPGMKIAISGSAPICPQNQCTISAVQDEQHLTIRTKPTDLDAAVHDTYKRRYRRG